MAPNPPAKPTRMLSAYKDNHFPVGIDRVVFRNFISLCLSPANRSGAVTRTNYLIDSPLLPILKMGFSYQL